ncbi:hypothetical protein A5844_001178 [Enterococcus sp. 10A9_DIV0425]|uniref:Glycosyltransferase RgtA/B/C/D-like domain-containing protein n=1 Tax=Candidatus Enterococcus wittei TaxID=1987383 RepID=A0A242K197_9ENTE|nr:DUF6020 family protein [Enterococcus sp. 10A9_DIV0425]OTP11044.1 hypothetical protein A5844_001178 [Enterococcus sp. 10A9_DIV0425]
MQTKTTRLLPAFFLTLLFFGISFFTAYGLGSLNPALILVLISLLWIVYKQLGVHLFSLEFDFQTIACLFFSALFALTLATGTRIQFTHVSASYKETSITTFSFFQVLVFLSTFIYCLLMLRFIIKILPDLTSYFTSNKAKPRSIWKYFLFFTSILLISWLPYALALYPGVVLPDSLSSIGQALGDAPLNNHHPILFTLIVQFFIDVLPISTINHGVFLFSMMQSLITALSISYSLCWLMKKKVPLIPIMISLGYFSLSPVFPIYVLNMQKDTLFSVACLLFSLTLFDIISQKDKPTFSLQVRLLILALLTTYLRNNGLYVVLGTGVVYGLISIKRKSYQAFVPIVLTYILLISLVIHPLMARYITPTQSAEQLGIPLQQVSRTLVMDGTMSEHDKEFMNQLLPLESYEVYAPSLADPIKWHKQFNNEFLNKHKKEFLMLWARNLPSNIQIYTDAYILDTFGFWIPNVKNSYGFLDTRVNTNSYGIKQADLIARYTGNSGMERIIAQRNFFGSGTLLWWVLFSLLLAVIIRNKKTIVLLLPGLLVFLTIMIATPVAFSLRYVFILALALPIYLIAPFLLEKNNETIGDSYEATEKN